MIPVPKPEELIGLPTHNLTPDQRKIYDHWQYERHREQKLLRNRRYRDHNPEKRASSQKQWRDANKEYLRQYMAKWWAKDPDRSRAIARESTAKRRAKKLTNPNYIAKQALKQEQKQKRIFEKSLAEALKISLRLHWEERKKLTRWQRATQLNPILKVRTNIRGRIYRQLSGRRKRDGTMDIIGCSMADLKRHLESQFKGRMSWENYGRTWHVDHIVPSSYFDLSKPEEIRRCYHFSNLRPLWAKTNMSQRDDRGPLTPFLGI